MSEIASAFVSLMPSARGFGSKLESQVGGEVNGAGKRLGSGFGKMFALAGAGLAAAGIGAFLKGSIAEAREAQKVGALTTSVIKATGGAANVTAAQVGKLAGALSLKTGIDDEVIQSGQNMLLTFKNVRNEAGKGNDIFSQSTKTLIDMSAAMGTDPKQAAIQLGKALNDPVKGISALSRVGVTFTEGQKETIKALVAGGDTMKAQKIILKELNSEFGGAAAAQATAGEKAAVAVGNLKEQIGTALLPLVDKIELAFVKAMPAISGFISGIGPAFSQIGAFLAPVVAQIQGFFGGGAGGGIAASLVAFGAVVQANFLPVLQTMAATFTGTILPAVTSFVTYIATALVPIFRTVAGIITGQVIPIIASLATFFYGTLYPAIVQIVAAVAGNLKPVFDQLVATFQSRVLPAIQNLLAKFREWQPTIQAVVMVVVKIIGKVLEFAAAILGKVLPVAIRFAGFLIGTLVGAIVGAIGVLVSIVKAVIKVGQQFVEGAKQIDAFVRKGIAKVGDFLSFMGDLPGKIKAAFSGAATFLLEAGKDIIRGLINGIKAMASQAAQAAVDVVKGAVSKAKSALGIHSPSRVFAELGMWSMLGFAKGIEDNAKHPLQALLDFMTKVRDRLRSSVDQIKSDMASLSSTISQAFTGNLFEATTAGDFIANLLDTKGQLQALKAAFKKLMKWGVSPQFLSQLFSSGNGGLILDLAAGGQGQAMEAAALFGQTQSLSTQLGNQVAQNDYGPELRKQTHRLEAVEKAVRQVGRDVARELDRKAAEAQRKKK